MRTSSTSCKRCDHTLKRYSGTTRSVSLGRDVLMLPNRSRPTRELRPPATEDEVFGPSDDPRPHRVEWRTLWTAARDGIDLFLRQHHHHPSRSESINKTDFDVARHPLRAWANHVLNSKWERRAVKTRVRGYVPLDNNGIAEELWLLRYELPGPEIERGLLEEFVPWEQRKEIDQQDRDLPELKS